MRAVVRALAFSGGLGALALTSYAAGSWQADPAPVTKEATMTIDATRIATNLAKHLETAWNAADGEGFGAVFTDGASFVDIRGDHHRSRVAIGKGHQAIFDGIYRDSTVTFEVTSASVVGHVVVAHAQIVMQAPLAPLPPNNGTTASFVIVDQGGAWRIAAFHNTLRLKPRA